MKLREIKQINQRRLELNSLGYISKSNLKEYLGCGSRMAERAWQEMTMQILKEGKTVSPFGLDPKRVMNYLNLTEAQIEKYASKGM
ncbi:MAG: hypothetical protein IKE94_15770 [Aeriscardovia sp.]|nr:hypothetical protein [Aeriscardovia sp.]